MKTVVNISLAALMLFVFSCTKESSSYRIVNKEESLSQADINSNFDSIKIGTQVWMKKDLTRSHYRNGDSIPQVQDSTEWGTLTTGAWCWYNNDSRLGKLYNYYAIIDPRGLAPEGWHVPSFNEWTKLSGHLGSNSVAGGKIKEAGTEHWSPPNIGATNSSGFTALPGGYRYALGRFDGHRTYATWWSTSELDSTYAFLFFVSSFNTSLGQSISYKTAGCAVRCLKD